MHQGRRELAASRSRRASALTLDAIPLAILGLGLARGRRAEGVLRELPLILLAVQATYFIVSTATVGGTPGQIALGLRVVDKSSGRLAGWRQAALRWGIRACPGLVLRPALQGAVRRRLSVVKHRLDAIEPDIEQVTDEWGDDPDDAGARVNGLYASVTGREALLPALILGGSGLAVGFAVIGGRVADRMSQTMVVTNRLRTRWPWAADDVAIHAT